MTCLARKEVTVSVVEPGWAPWDAHHSQLTWNPLHELSRRCFRGRPIRDVGLSSDRFGLCCEIGKANSTNQAIRKSAGGE